MAVLFTRGKFPAVNLTSVFPRGKVFFTVGSARPSPVAKTSSAVGLRGQYFQAVLYIARVEDCTITICTLHLMSPIVPF